MLLWSSGFIPSRVLLREMSPLWAAEVRISLASVILLCVAALGGLPLPARRQQWTAAIQIGILTNVIYLALVNIALRHLSAGMAAIIASTNPLILAMIAPRLLGEALTKAKSVGMVIGFCGVAFIMIARAGAPTERPLDIALAFVAVVGLVGATVVYKRARFATRLIPVITGIQLLVGAICVLPVAASIEGPLQLPHSAHGRWALTYLVLVMSVGASMLWVWLLNRGEATRISAYYFCVPVIGTVLSHYTLGEPLTNRDALGTVAIAVGISLVQRTAPSSVREAGAAHRGTKERG